MAAVALNGVKTHRALSTILQCSGYHNPALLPCNNQPSCSYTYCNLNNRPFPSQSLRAQVQCFVPQPLSCIHPALFPLNSTGAAHPVLRDDWCAPGYELAFLLQRLTRRREVSWGTRQIYPLINCCKHSPEHVWSPLLPGCQCLQMSGPAPRLCISLVMLCAPIVPLMGLRGTG